MDRYQKVEKPRGEQSINENEIRITSQGRMRNYITYAMALLQEKGSSEIVFKAMGRAINKTVTIVELIKRRIVGLHQITSIGSTDITDTWEPLEEGLLPSKSQETLTRPRFAFRIVRTQTRYDRDSDRSGSRSGSLYSAFPKHINQRTEVYWYGVPKSIAMTKINDVEANLEQFKSETLAWQKETSNRFNRMQESIDKNKAADKQFAELLQLLKALQPSTTLPATIPCFEENMKEDLGQKLIDDLDEPLMVLESDGMTNKNEFAVVVPVVAIAPIVVAPIVVAPVAPVVVTPVEPSFIPLGNQAEHHKMFIWYIILKLGYEICLGHLLTNVRLKQEPEPAQRRTWDPGITHEDILKQHLEDKVFLGAGVLI
ncbi:DNA/RNA-binding protein Alba-like protein [Tanacetum coccineum]